jgi:hypothetical protein
MRDKTGVQDLDNLKLLKITGLATREGETRSLWSFFREQYSDLSLWQTIKAGLVYWLLYQTSLISNTVQAYLNKFLENVTASKDNSQARLKVIRTLIANANAFCVEDIRATKAFAYASEAGGGDLEAYRDRAIKQHYGNSLEALCRAFSEKRVETDSPTVPFFPHSQKIPLLGVFFKGLEWALNRLVIKKLMKSTILPAALQSTVENGLEATQPHNIVFSLHLTRFITMQLEKLRMTLSDATPSPEPTEMPGTELLSPLIKNLSIALELEAHKTPLDLQAKFLEIEQGKWFLDKKIEQGIQEGVKLGLHHLFAYLDEAVQSGEIMATMLQLSSAPFEPSAEKDQATLMAEYKEEQVKLKRAAGETFRKIIQVAVDKQLSGNKPEEATRKATVAFGDGQTVAKRTLDKLKLLCEQMTQKIERSGPTTPLAHPQQELSADAEQARIAANNVQDEVAAFLQTMQVLSTRKETQERIDALPLQDRDTIWSLMEPVFKQGAAIQEKVLRLQELQDHYPAHANVSHQFEQIRGFSESLRAQFQTQPKHPRAALLQKLKDAGQELGTVLGAKAPATLHAQGSIRQICDLSESVANQQQVLDVLYTLYPPRVDQGAQPAGLLDQLVDYERGAHPHGFQPKVCLQEIDKLLLLFPDDPHSQTEQQQLRHLIDTGTNLTAQWGAISTLLQQIYARHKAIRDRDSLQLVTSLSETAHWGREKQVKYNLLKNQDHSEMRQLMGEITADVRHLREDAYLLQLHLPFHFSSGQTKAFTALAGAGVGGLLVGAGSLLGGPLGGAAGAGLSALLYTGTQNRNQLSAKDPAAWGKAAGSFAFGAATSYLLPGAQAFIGPASGALTGAQLDQAIHSTVLPEVMRTFENGVTFGMSPRVAHAVATRALRAMTVA